MGREGGRNDGGNSDGQNDRSAYETLNLTELISRTRSHRGDGCALLLLRGSSEHQQFFPLTKNAVVIGRSENADLVLRDPAISDFHARIIRHSFGYTIQDMGSVEGTFLHDRRIHHVHARLSDGDLLRIGNALLAFVDGRASSRRIPPPAHAVAPVTVGSTITSQETVTRIRYSEPSSVREVATDHSPRPSRMKPWNREEPEPSVEDALRKIIKAARFVRRHLFLIVAFAAVFLVLSALSFFVLPPVRAASCMVTLYPAPKTNPVDSGQPKSNSDEMSFFVGADRAFLSNENVMSTLKRMGVPHPNERESARIVKQMHFENLGNNTYLATLTPGLWDPRDDWQLRFLDAHVKNYIETEVERKLKVFVAEVDFLRSQTADAENRVQEITQETVRYRETHSEQILAQSTLVSSPSQLETRRIELAGRISRLRGEIDGIRSQLTRGSALGQARAQSGQSDREALASLNRRLAELRAQGFADGHPDVERVLNERTALQKAIYDHQHSDVTQFEKTSNTVYDGLQSQVDQLQAQLKAARSELAFIEGNRRSLRAVGVESPKVSARLDELVRIKDDAVRQHGRLYDQLKKAEIQLKLERVSATSRYEIVVPPHLDYPPGRVAFAARLALGIGIGLLLAGLILCIAELRKLFARVARETPAAIVLLAMAGALLQGCAHDGPYVWIEDLPARGANAEPLIYPHDTLLIEVEKHSTLSGEFIVRDDGHYSQPMAGSIYVAGKTPREIANEVAAVLREVVVAPIVSVWISKRHPIKVSIVGEVKAPGVYELTRNRSLLSALALAGWLSEFAHDDRVFVVRLGARERIRFRVRDITNAEPRASEFQLADADVVVVE